MSKVETLDETVESFIVPARVWVDVTRDRTDLNIFLREEGISLDEAVEIISSDPKSDVVWEDGFGGNGFYFHYTDFVKQRDESHIPVEKSRKAIASEILEALHSIQNSKIDRRKTWFDKSMGYLSNYTSILKKVAVIGGAIVALAVIGRSGQLENRTKNLESITESYNNHSTVVVESMLENDSRFEETYTGNMPDLISRAAVETGINEDIFRAMIAYGSSDDSKNLREKGYVGLIPVNPVSAGAASRLLESDDYFSLLAFADEYKKIRESTVDDETALALYLTSRDTVIDAKSKAKIAKQSLDMRDKSLERDKDIITRQKRNLDILECIRSESEPDESLFEPIYYKIAKEAPVKWYSEEDFRRIFNHYKALYLESREFFNRHYSDIKTEYGRRSGDTPETRKETQTFIEQSVWFTNLPEYATKVIARLYGGPK